MARSLTFLHTADLHLGAPIRGLQALDEAWTERVLRAIPEAYDRVIDAAITNQVDLMIIAGDSFDMSHPSYGDYRHYLEGLERLEEAGIPVYLVTGNHDPYTSWSGGSSDLPGNAHMFPAEEPGFFAFERDGRPLALLGGRSYGHHTWPPDKSIAEGISRSTAEAALHVRAPFAIGVVHTGLNLDPYKSPTSREELSEAGMDYWALGHIHSPYVDDEADPSIVFSGCIQGRSLLERGRRGVNLVTLTEGAPNRMRFIPTASIVIEKLAVDVSACASLGEVVELTMRRLFAINGAADCDEMISIISLTGTTPLHRLLSRAEVREDLRQRINRQYRLFFCDALQDETRMPFDPATLRREGLFPSVFLEVSDEARSQAADELTEIQRSLDKDGVMLPLAHGKQIARLADAADAMVMDELLGGQE